MRNSIDQWLDFFRRLGRSRVLGAVLAAAALWFALASWERPPSPAVDWPVLALALLSSAAAYLIALMCLSHAVAPSAPWVSALAGQLLKYVPGTVWQAQPVAATSGIAGVGRLALATLSAASVAIALVGSWFSLVGVGLFVAISVAAGRIVGTRTALRVSMLGALAAGLIALSGGLLGGLVVGNGPSWARSIASAWGIGVYAVPVPAGIGVREAALALLEQGPSAPLVAGLHRAVSTAVDIVAGGLALWLHHRRQPAQTGPH